MTFSYFLLVLTPYSFLIPSCYLEGGLEILLHSSTLLFYILLLYSLVLYFLGFKTLWAAFLDFLWGFFVWHYQKFYRRDGGAAGVGAFCF